MCFQKQNSALCPMPLAERSFWKWGAHPLGKQTLGVGRLAVFSTTFPEHPKMSVSGLDLGRCLGPVDQARGLGRARCGEMADAPDRWPFRGPDVHPQRPLGERGLVWRLRVQSGSLRQSSWGPWGTGCGHLHTVPPPCPVTMPKPS